MYCTERIRVAHKLINLTDKPIQVYDKLSGSIVAIYPESHVLPAQPLKQDLEEKTYYIFNKKVANRLKKSGRTLSDIAIIKRKARGRSDTEITTLVWGENIAKEVGLCNFDDYYIKEAHRGA